VLCGGGSRCRVQPDCRRDQQAGARDREQSPAGARPGPERDRESDQSESNDSDRHLNQKGGLEAGLGQPADRPSQRVIAWSQPPGEQHRDGGGGRRQHSQPAGQSFHCRTSA